VGSARQKIARLIALSVELRSNCYVNRAMRAEYEEALHHDQDRVELCLQAGGHR